MGIFEDAVLSAKTLAGTVGKKAGELYEISVKKLKLSELNEKAEKFYADEKKNGTSHTEECAAIIAELDALAGEISKLEAEINELKKYRQCKKCGFSNVKEAVFCCKCGVIFE